MSTSASTLNNIYINEYNLLKVIIMIQEICVTSNSLELRTEKKKHENDIRFEKIVKFLNDQKSVMDYAGLN
ncbi:MAG: hypothetical protein C3F06_13860 [Candidatus Methanoperedenaceae archaeon]|nr:MAG: hypothetical protein C3F06_13860 [Candidatus Methanoperedenaceae archaeon]